MHAIPEAPRPWRLAVAVPLLVLVSGCAGDRQLLEDPGFEDGGMGWFWLERSPDWAGYEVVEGQAADGELSARMHLVSEGHGGDTRIVGLVQNVTFGRLPDRLGGNYRVERWETGVDKTYLQAVVTLFPPPGADQPLCPGLPDPSNPCQIAFPLAGLDRIPFSIANRRFVFIDTDEPAVGPWRGFDIALRDEFTRAWGAEPRKASYAWIYFEARYERSEADAPSAGVDAVVHWDDLYLRG